MPDRLPPAVSSLASMSIVPTQLQQACAIIRDEVGTHVPIVEPGWQAFARACGMRALEDPAEIAATDRVVFVAANLQSVLARLGEWSERGDADEREFGLVVPAAVVGRGALPADPTLQLWQKGYTPVTVHRIPVDTGVGLVEVVAAAVRSTPPRPTPVE